ncbi:zinc knuckle CX2CX4HX4C containing protein [Tanacetum coccineum]
MNPWKRGFGSLVEELNASRKNDTCNEWSMGQSLTFPTDIVFSTSNEETRTNREPCFGPKPSSPSFTILLQENTMVFQLVEIYVLNAWKKFVVECIMGIKGVLCSSSSLLLLDVNRFMMHNIKIEYEWKPSRCGTCLVFGHDDALCPKHANTERKAFCGSMTREQEVKVDCNQPKKQQFIHVTRKTNMGASILTSTPVSNVFEVLSDLEDDGHLDTLNAEDPKRNSGYSHGGKSC